MPIFSYLLDSNAVQFQVGIVKQFYFYLDNFINFFGFKFLFIFIVFLFFFKSFILISIYKYISTQQGNLLVNLKNDFLSKIINSDILVFNKFKSGSLSTVVNEEVNRSVSLFKLLTEFIISLYSAFIFIIVLILFNYQLFFLISVLSLASIFFIFPLIRYTKNQSNKFFDLNKEISDKILNIINSYEYLKISKSFNFLKNPIELLVKSHSKTFSRIAFIEGLISSLREPIAIVFIVSVFLFASRFQISLDEMVVYCLLIYKSANNLYAIQANVQKIYTGHAVTTSIKKNLDELGKIKLNKRKSKNIYLKSFNTLEFKEVTFGYTDNKILQSINFEIINGEIIEINGQSGVGKSTLIKLISGLFPPDSGLIKINGIDIQKINLNSWSEMMGYVSQNPYIYSGTLAQNIILEFSNNISVNKIKRLNNLIDFLNLDDFINQELGGLNKIILDRGISLSGGQKQKISILRELFKHPKVLLLDEPTSNLDKLSEEKFIQIINSLSKKITIILITHKKKLFENTNKYFEIKNKKLKIKNKS